jgi:hypothetical protein
MSLNSNNQRAKYTYQAKTLHLPLAYHYNLCSFYPDLFRYPNDLDIKAP